MMSAYTSYDCSTIDYSLWMCSGSIRPELVSLTIWTSGKLILSWSRQALVSRHLYRLQVRICHKNPFLPKLQDKINWIKNNYNYMGMKSLYKDNITLRWSNIWIFIQLYMASIVCGLKCIMRDACLMRTCYIIEICWDLLRLYHKHDMWYI